MTVKVGGVEFDVDVDSSGVVSGSSKINSSLEGVESAFKQVDNAATQSGNKMAQAATKGSKGMSQLRGAAGQLGFQLQDIAVQAQMGTNALVILGQQGSQIAGIFGPTGAIVGGVIAVGAAIASVMVPSMMEGGDKTEELTEKLKELGKTNELTINQQKFLKQVQEEEAAAKAEKVKELEKEIKAQQELIKNLDESAAGYGRMAAASRARIDNGAIKEMQAELIRLQAELDTTNEKFGAASVDPEKNKQAIKAVAERIALVQRANDEEFAIIANGIKYQVTAEMSKYEQLQAIQDEQFEARKIRQQSQYESLVQSMEAEKTAILENEALTEEQKAALLDTYRDEEAEAKYNHALRLTNIERDAAKAREDILKAEQQAKKQILSSTLSNLSALMNTESRKQFEIGKAAALAGAAVTGVDAAIKAWDAGMATGGPWAPAVAAAYAASSLAKTGAMISQIKNTQFGSASSGQSYSGGTVANNVASGGGEQVTRREISLNFTGSAPTNAQELADILNEAAGDGVTFNLGGR